MFKTFLNFKDKPFWFSPLSQLLPEYQHFESNRYWISSFKIAFIVYGLFWCSFINSTNHKYSPEKYNYYFKDSLYKNGFLLSSIYDGDSTKFGELKYGIKNNNKPLWLICQWNNFNNNLNETTYSYKTYEHVYTTKNKGVEVKINNKNGSLTLTLNTSTEFGLNGIMTQPRKENEPWPHLLLSPLVKKSNFISLADKKEILMNISYKITKVKEEMRGFVANKNLHSAQFQWFINVQNRNNLSPDYKKFFWFGLSFYDKRYKHSPLYQSVDGGKPNHTNSFIYMPDMKKIMANKNLSIYRRQNVCVDILPFIKEALLQAKKQQFLPNSDLSDLFIAGSNIGWEVTGTYDVEVEIYQFNLLYQ